MITRWNWTDKTCYLSHLNIEKTSFLLSIQLILQYSLDWEIERLSLLEVSMTEKGYNAAFVCSHSQQFMFHPFGILEQESP